jgi:hypothetical protein
VLVKEETIKTEEAIEPETSLEAGKTAGTKRAHKTVKTLADVRNTILQWSEEKVLAEPLAAEFVAAIDSYTPAEPKRKRAKKAE